MNPFIPLSKFSNCLLRTSRLSFGFRRTLATQHDSSKLRNSPNAQNANLKVDQKVEKNTATYKPPAFGNEITPDQPYFPAWAKEREPGNYVIISVLLLLIGGIYFYTLQSVGKNDFSEFENEKKFINKKPVDSIVVTTSSSTSTSGKGPLVPTQSPDAFKK